MTSLQISIVGASWGHWKLRGWRKQARAIAAASDELHSFNDDQLLHEARELRWQASRGVRLRSLLPNAYAMVREASRRAHNQPHFEVQIIAGVALFDSVVAQMQTGEGKTLAALLPAFLHALAGRGCHIVTANDYLAERDAGMARQILTRLGMSVGCLRDGLARPLRHEHYACDLTFGTAREFGFDFLRDRMARSMGEKPVQRGRHFALVDEADSVLIDDARTPLLIATAPPDSSSAQQAAQWCAGVTSQLTSGLDFKMEAKSCSAQLTVAGLRNLLRRKPKQLAALAMDAACDQVENALVAEHLLQKDRDYVIEDGDVRIVDESSGRVSDGRKWQKGLHQAVEAKESVEISEPTETAARVTVQSYFRGYRFLAGLTGTAQEAAGEFRQVYRLRVVDIPTRLPCRRRGLQHRIFSSQAAKYNAIADDVQYRSAAGQAVLIGAPSVEASEKLSGQLEDRGLPHSVLNCRHHADEAQVVAAAGRAGRITIATNMAGRGTDIRVEEQVQAIGGLHVIATEMHSQRRIDRQLIGRSARQGEPGSFQFFLSLEDELFRDGDILPESLRCKAGGSDELPPSWIKFFQRAQRAIDRRHTRQRRDLLAREKRREDSCEKLGLDPLLDVIDD